MSVITAQPNEITANSPVLTAREQEVLDLLLEGSVPKEVAATLNISHSTVLDHKKNIYRKLDVHSINELLTKYSQRKAAISGEINTESARGAALHFEMPKIKSNNNVNKKLLFLFGIIILVIIAFIIILNILIRDTVIVSNDDTVMFGRLTSFHDPDSTIDLVISAEMFGKQNYTTYTISGTLSGSIFAYAGIWAPPVHSTLQDMKAMTSLSFTVLGDGNSYDVMLPTTETRTKAQDNHYKHRFTTQKDQVSTFTFNIDDFTQAEFNGSIKVEFIQSNIEAFQIHAGSAGDFNLKFWDIKFY